MNVAELVIKIGASTDSLEAGLARAQQLTEAAAGRAVRAANEAGKAEQQAAAEAAAAQDRFTAAVQRTTAQLQLLKGDALGALRTTFGPSVSEQQIAGFAALRGELTQAKGALAEQARETVAAEVAQQRFASALAKTNAELAGLKGDSLAKLRIQFPGVSDAELAGLHRARKAVDDYTASQRRLREVVSSSAFQQAARGMEVLGAAGIVGLGASVKVAIDFEKNFASIAKAVDATKPQLAALKEQFEQLSKKVPVSFGDLTKIGAIAAEAGVGRESLAKFTEVIAKLQATVRVGGDELTMSFAKIANVMREPTANIDRMGATLIGLGNAFAATEPEILAMTERMTGIAPVINMNTRTVMAFGAAMASSGIEAERGGTALQRLFMGLYGAVQSGGPKLREFAAVAGMTGQEFQKLFKADPGRAFLAFETGLDRLKQAHVNILPLMEQLGVKNVRVTETVLKMANAHDLLKAALDKADQSWEQNTVLNEKFGIKTDTTASKIQLFENNLAITAEKLGKGFLPALNNTLDRLQPFLEWFQKLSPAAQNASLGIGAAGAAVVALGGWIGTVLPGALKLAEVLGKIGKGGAGAAAAAAGGGEAAAVAGGAVAGGEAAPTAAAGAAGGLGLAGTGGLLAGLAAVVAGRAELSKNKYLDAAAPFIESMPGGPGAIAVGGLAHYVAGLFGAHLPGDAEAGRTPASDAARRGELYGPPEAAGPGAGGGGQSVKRLGTTKKDVDDVAAAFAAGSKDAQAFAAASGSLDAKLIDLKEKLAGNEMSLAALHKRYPDVSEAALKLYRAHELEARQLEKTIKARDQHTAALKRAADEFNAFMTKQKEEAAELATGSDALAKFRAAHKDWSEARKAAGFAAQQHTEKMREGRKAIDEFNAAQAKTLGETRDLKAALEGHATTLGKVRAEHEHWTDAQVRSHAAALDVRADTEKQKTAFQSLTNDVETARGKLLEAQASAAAGGRAWDVHGLALEKTHRAYESLSPSMRAAVDELAKLGRQTESVNLLAKAGDELRKAVAQFQALRSGDPSRILSAEHVGADADTLAKLGAYQEQIKGITAALGIAKSARDSLDQKITTSLAAFAGTGKVKTDTDYQREDLLRTLTALNQNAGLTQSQGDVMARFGGTALTPEQMARMQKALGATPFTEGDQAARFSQLQGSLGADQMKLLGQVSGSPGAFFGKVGDDLKTKSKTAFDDFGKELKAGTDTFTEQTKSTFAAFSAGLTEAVDQLQGVISSVGQSLATALSSVGSSVSGARAGGGPVSGGSSYLVGERGPELFVPSSGGSIVPNGAGGDVHHTQVTFNIATPDVHSFRQSQSQIATDMHRALEYARARNGG